MDRDAAGDALHPTPPSLFESHHWPVRPGNIPELRDHRVLRSTTEGLLVLHHEVTDIIRLLNPLTRQVADLPPITSIGDDFECDSPDSAGLVDYRTVLLYFCRISTLAFAKPGDKHWLLIKIDDFLMPTMSFAGRFYGVADHAVMMVEVRENLPPRLVEAAELVKPFSRMFDSVHLVDNAGELVLVHRKLSRISTTDIFNRKYKAYRVDTDAGKMIRVHGVGGRALFIGQFHAVSVSPRVFSFICADTVYPGFNGELITDYKQIGAYHLTDGSTEPSNYNTESGLVDPLSVIDFLTVHVSG